MTVLIYLMCDTITSVVSKQNGSLKNFTKVVLSSNSRGSEHFWKPPDTYHTEAKVESNCIM